MTNAQSRQADAQQAVDNFSADLATKKAALDDAKAKLADAQTVQEVKQLHLTQQKLNSQNKKQLLQA